MQFFSFEILFITPEQLTRTVHTWALFNCFRADQLMVSDC